ncbi:uncharacterized protein LY79DRAFT_380026 [Colletotrichum navitas]|uniref:Uncharacterized protein n=1 Tax=Colletotrichum navitas TaxID=681940 RepID=A0AAD8Q948_9PEZI|nr:uncharacterized protein LY79DRAFT_380026 [Colletotrichum navitas]KAK1597282.1 hypothetical protein LY79DRAFT_380026 [Colletotrichum navitas]
MAGWMMSELIYGDKRVCDISYSSSNPPGAHVFTRFLVEQASIIPFSLLRHYETTRLPIICITSHVFYSLRPPFLCFANDQRNDEEHEAFTHYAITTYHHLDLTKRIISCRILPPRLLYCIMPTCNERKIHKKGREESSLDAPEVGGGVYQAKICGRWDELEFGGRRRKKARSWAILCQRRRCLHCSQE